MVNGKRVWTYGDRRVSVERKGILEAYWEVSLDPLSDSYRRDDISASDLLTMWAEQAEAMYPNLLIPIYWFVRGEIRTFERMPFQYPHSTQTETFLNYFTWPVTEKTRKPLNWLTLPVVDKLWDAKRRDKGGFIQQATGWKPSVLQPFVYLPALCTV